MGPCSNDGVLTALMMPARPGRRQAPEQRRRPVRIVSGAPEGRRPGERAARRAPRRSGRPRRSRAARHARRTTRGGGSRPAGRRPRERGRRSSGHRCAQPACRRRRTQASNEAAAQPDEAEVGRRAQRLVDDHAGAPAGERKARAGTACRTAASRWPGRAAARPGARSMTPSSDTPVTMSTNSSAPAAMRRPRRRAASGAGGSRGSRASSPAYRTGPKTTSTPAQATPRSARAAPPRALRSRRASDPAAPCGVPAASWLSGSVISSTLPRRRHS